MSKVTLISAWPAKYCTFFRFAPDKIKFTRIDSEIGDVLKKEEADDSALTEIIKNVLNDDKLTIKTQALKNDKLPAIMVVDEYMRRYSEMGKYYGMSEGDIAKTLIVNISCPIISKIKELNETKQNFVIRYIYLLALSSFKKLTQEETEELQNLNLSLLNDYIR